MFLSKEPKAPIILTLSFNCEADESATFAKVELLVRVKTCH